MGRMEVLRNNLNFMYAYFKILTVNIIFDVII